MFIFHQPHFHFLSYGLWKDSMWPLCGHWHWIMARAVELEVGSQWTTAGEEQAGPRNTPGSQPAAPSLVLPKGGL